MFQGTETPGKKIGGHLDWMFQDKCTSDDTKKADEQNLGRNQNSNKSNSVLTIFTNMVHTAPSFYKDEEYWKFLILVTSESQLLEMLRVFNVASPVVITWLVGK